MTQQLAGHADIKTTQKFYLSVQDDDLRARRAQQQIVMGLSTVVVSEPTDQELTNSALKPCCPKRKVLASGTQLLGKSNVA